MFKKKYSWHVQESLEAMRIMEDELSRLHRLADELRKEKNGSGTITLRRDMVLDEIAEINNYRVTVAKRIAGLEY